MNECEKIEIASSKTKIGVVCDFVEEGWYSMDLVADMLLENINAAQDAGFEAQRICPAMRLQFSKLPWLKKQRAVFNADRLLNRMRYYPRHLRYHLQSGAPPCDLYHIVDHSYAHLVHELPAARTIVTCHDLDTFECLLEPRKQPRPKWFRIMTARILSGLQKAARVTCDSRATRDQILYYKLLPPERLAIVSPGVHPTCTPEPNPTTDERINDLLGAKRTDTLEILHVGSTIARKRIDVLLRVFAEIIKDFPHARLIRVGGAFTSEQETLIDALRIRERICALPFLSREELAAVYRRVTLVVQPSAQEGFGLPIVEALACGAPVVASDLPVLREVGGEAAEYCAVAEIEAWRAKIVALIIERQNQPEAWQARRQRGFKQAAQFSWANCAQQMMRIYRAVLNS